MGKHFFVQFAGAVLLVTSTALPIQAKPLKDWKCTGNSDIPWNEQIADCTRAIKSGKLVRGDKIVALYDRGLVYLNVGDNDRAIADYSQAIALDPKLALSYSGRAYAYNAKGDYDHAIADYSQAIALDPNVAFAYNNRGNSYQEKGDLDHAIADYNQAIALDPKLAPAYYDRGNTYYKKGDFDHAIADYSQAILLDPKLALAYRDRGTAYFAKSDFDRAIADYREAISLDPKLASAYYNRGDAYRAKGDNDHATADFNEAARLDPKSGLAQGAQWSPFWDALAKRADAKVIDGVNDKGEQTRRIELSSGVTYFLERHGNQISVLDGDMSGHGPVQCYWEIYVTMRVHAALCSPGEDPKLEADLDLALDRIDDFIVENSLVPITKPQLTEALLKRKQRALGQSQADRRKQCDAEDSGFTILVKGMMTDREKWMASLNNLLSVKRPPVMNPCL